MKKKIIFLIITISAIVVFYILYLRIFPSHFKDSDVEELIKLATIILAVVTILIAFFQWKVSKTKAEHEIYLDVIKILSDAKTQAAYVGASLILRDLAFNSKKKYCKLAIAVIETSIRELSQKTLEEWIIKVVGGTECSFGPVEGKLRLTAIKEMLDIVIDLRSLGKDDSLLPMDLGYADLRILAGQNFAKYFPFLMKANLRRTDLRFLSIDEFEVIESNRVGGAWFSLEKDKLFKINFLDTYEIDFDYMKGLNLFLNKTQARFFLTGDWSLESLKMPTEKNKRDYENIFREGRIAGGPGVRFDSLNMQKCDFYNAVLVRASFVNANLEDANFMDADLRNCNFRGAIIKNAKFHGAALDGAVFDLDRIETGSGLKHSLIKT